MMVDVAEQYDTVQKDYQGKDGRELIEKLSLKEGCNVLDLGCGTGYLTGLLAERVGEQGTVTGIDPDAGRIAVARRKYAGLKNATFLEGSCENMPTGAYDLVFSNHVMHWIEDKERAFTNVHSHLKEGGKFAFVASIMKAPTSDLFSPSVKKLFHFCGGDVYEKLAKERGFEIQVMSFEPKRYTFCSADQYLLWVTATIGAKDCLAGSDRVQKFREKFSGGKPVHVNFTAATFVLQK